MNGSFLLRLTQGIACAVALLVGVACVTSQVRAAVPEPDTVVWGVINLGGTNLAPAQNVVVQARRIPMGASVSETRLGDVDPTRYSLRIPIDSGLPLLRPNASVAGNTLYLTVLVAGQVRAQVTYDVEGKGVVRRIDFGDVDDDKDGLPDGWEQANLLDTRFGAADDPDADGLSNADEFRLGTLPSKVDAPHPADLSPRDGRITIGELAAYYTAWKRTNDWPLAPKPIPIDYVTRASTIWEGGEYYRQVLTNNGVALAAPLWWVNAAAPTNAGPGSVEVEPRRGAGLAGDPSPRPLLEVESIHPPRFLPGVRSGVMLRARVIEGMRTYAVEDGPPQGWRVESISAGGTWDPKERRVKWGPFFDRVPRDFSYVVVPDRVVSGQAFEGRGSHDGVLVSMSGARAVGVPSSTLRVAGAVGDWTLSGEPGARYEVERSVDLKDWTLLTNGVADGAGLFRFGPALPTDLPQVFVRAREAGR